MSPNKSKLSIDFLVNPCGLASDRKEEVLPGFHTTLPHQRSLLSYLDPMTTLATTAAAMQASMTMPAHYPPLVLYR
ncbi:Shikimate 5-dehydrogenase [Phytophthora palmivora]|uniref:Shikimate 5-dehydrogenase n=1 Tax=Phytophthora palmivora TaxID=4796 RepID=A0A2P4XJK7_9STRA|nr:Shikimate 5-dehydrogenase [Phytophthora palmivora]POM76218.1 Shikimate 5-dehydrogenase [Phytophthora palmivora]